MLNKNIKSLFSVIIALMTAMIPAAAPASDLLEKPAKMPAETLTVSQAVEEAVANNPQVSEAAEYIKSAESSQNSAKAALFPTLSASYDYTSLKEPPEMKLATGAMQTAHQNQYNWAVTVIQPLFTGFALTSRLEMAKLENRIKKLEKNQVILDITRDVKIACCKLILARKLMSVAEDEVETLSAHKKDAQLFYNQQLIPKNDLLRSEVGLANSLQQRESSRAGVEKAAARLNRLLNRPLTSDIRLTEDRNVPELTGSFDEYTRQALEYRPVMQSVRLSLESLGFSEKIVRSALYPQISLTGGYEQSGDDLWASSNDYSNEYNAFVGISATWTLWDWGRIRSDASAVNHQARALESGIRTLANQIRQEVRNAELDCDVAKKNIETAAQALDQARENWRITNVQYQQQVATSTDVLDARSFLSQADTNYYNALYGYLMAVAELDRVIGKGGAKPL